MQSADCEYTIARFLPRIEGDNARIERWTRRDGDVHWRTVSPENTLTVYGSDAASRIADPVVPTRVFGWLANESRDDKGNVMLYEYAAKNDDGVDVALPYERSRSRSAGRYLKRIRYGNRFTTLDTQGQRPRWLAAEVRDGDWLYELVFDYGDHATAVPQPDDAWPSRADPFSSYRAGFEVRMLRLCHRVLMFHHFPDEPGVGRDCLVRETSFSYADDVGDATQAPYARLIAITHKGCRGAVDGGDAALPPLEFDYGALRIDPAVRSLDGDTTLSTAPRVDGKPWRWTDLAGKGLPGNLSEQGSAWYFQRNHGPLRDKGDLSLESHFGSVEPLPSRPNISLRGPVQFTDLAGDGQPDVVVMEGFGAGLYERDIERGGWKGFRPFPTSPSGGLQGPSLRLVDLDGDGHADLLVSEDDAYHASLAEEGSSAMKTSVRRVELSRSEVDYLKTAGFLPQALLEFLQKVHWRSDFTGAFEIPGSRAEEFRDTFTEQLAKVGFNESYEPTAEGFLIESLIDRFHEGRSRQASDVPPFTRSPFLLYEDVLTGVNRTLSREQAGLTILAEKNLTPR